MGARGSWWVVPLCGLALAACRGPERGDGAPEGPGPVPVEVRRLAPRTLERVERRTARVEARREVSLAFGVPGRVTRIRFDEGERVAKGALLAALDTRALEAQVKQASAQRAQAARELERARALRTKNAVAAQRVDSLESGLEIAEAQLEAARAQLDQGRIRAPFAADVVGRLAEPGAWANPGVPVLHLAELDPIRVVAQVPDQVRPLVRVGAQARVFAQGLGAPRVGEVAQVSPVVDPKTGLFRVEIDLPNPDRRLAAGQPVEVRIDAERLEDVLVVEPEWVVYRRAGPAVVLVEDGRAKTVALGPRAQRVEGRFAVPQADLPALPLIVKGQSLVRDGGPVQILEPEDETVAESAGE